MKDNMLPWLKKHKKAITLSLVILVLTPISIITFIFLSFYIQVETDGKYSLLGPLARLDIIISNDNSFDFQIKQGVWDVDTIEFYDENSKKLLWKVRFFYNSKTEKTEYIAYGKIQKGNMYQIFPSLGISEGFLSHEEQMKVNRLSINGVAPQPLHNGQKIRAKIVSYCGHSFEQPNCSEERLFVFENNRFKEE